MPRIIKVSHKRNSPYRNINLSGIVTPSGGVSNSVHTPSGSYPNEPLGFSRLCEHDYSVKPGAPGGGQLNYGDTPSGPAGSWWAETSPTQANMSLGSENGDSFLRMRYPVGQNVGSQPVFYVGWINGVGGNGTEQRIKLYIYQRFRFIGPPGNEGNFEFNAVGVKFNYTPHLTLESINQSPIIFRPVPSFNLGSLQLRTQYRVTIYTKTTGTSCGPSSTFPAAWEREANINYNAAICNVNEWVEMEQLFEMNDATCPPTPNGRFRIWVNNVLTHDYQNVSMRTIAPYNYAYHQYRMAPVYGGVDTPVKSREDFIDIAHTYVSGIAL